MGTHTRILIGLASWLWLGMMALLFEVVAPYGVAAWLLAYIPALIMLLGAGAGIIISIIGVLIGLTASPHR